MASETDEITEEAGSDAEADLDEQIGTLQEGCRADAAVLLRFGSYLDEIWVTEVRCQGDAVACKIWGQLRGQTPPAGFDHDSRDEILALRTGQWCLQAPRKTHFNTFCWLDEDFEQPSVWRQTPAYRQLYQPAGLRTYARAIFYDDSKLCGLVTFGWKQSPHDRDAVISLFDRHARELRRCLANHCVPLPRKPRYVVLREDATLVSTDGQDWLTPERQATLCKLAHQPEQTRAIIDHYTASWTPIGSSNETAHLFRLMPLSPVTEKPQLCLFDHQHQLAELVARGLSNQEIADQLDISINTVKYHLKRIYHILGVASRVELAAVLNR